MAERREDLERLLSRRALTEDAARPEAVEKRHAAGGRTARENLEDLIDPAETRGLIARTLAAAGASLGRDERGGRFVDTW